MPTPAGFLLSPFYLIVAWAYVVLSTPKNKFPSLDNTPWKCKQPSRNGKIRKNHLRLSNWLSAMETMVPKETGNLPGISCWGGGEGISCNGKWSLTKRFHTVPTTYQTTLLMRLKARQWWASSHLDQGCLNVPSFALYWNFTLTSEPQRQTFWAQIIFIPLPYVTTLNQFPFSPFLTFNRAVSTGLWRALVGIQTVTPKFSDSNALSDKPISMLHKSPRSLLVQPTQQLRCAITMY